MNLFYRKLGCGRPLIILHGLYGSSDNWYSVGKELSSNYEVYLIDQRNHGKSPHLPELDYFLLSADLFEFIDQNNIENPIIIGHSMGGKTAMLYAIQHPEAIAKLIIVDIAPRTYSSLTEYSTEALLHLNIIRALLDLDLTLIKSRTEADLELGKTIKDIRIRQFLLKNLERNADNVYQWKLNLDAISRNITKIFDWPDITKLPDNLPQRNFPVLFIKGEKSSYIRDQDFPVIKNIFPNSRITSILHSGHWIHAQQPELFMKVLNSFLDTKDNKIY